MDYNNSVEELYADDEVYENDAAIPMEGGGEGEQIYERLFRIKVMQIEAKWLKNVHDIMNSDKGLTYKISCIYAVFSIAAGDYRDVPVIVEKARAYAQNIIKIVQDITGTSIQELADQINGRENSIPRNLLYWCDILEEHKELLYFHVSRMMRDEIGRFLGEFSEQN